MNGIFSGAQREYAKHQIATFPIRSDKSPAITNYQRVGLRGSAALTEKFGNASGLGFMTNARNRITVLDVDSPDERIFERALNCHGDSPVKVQTANGKFHIYYRYNGERRLIRGFGDTPVDVLGAGGFAIAPPTFVPDKGSYHFVQGGLDDFCRLPVLQNLPENAYVNGTQNVSKLALVPETRRNNELYRHCMLAAKKADSLDALLYSAGVFNDACCSPPLLEEEVVRTAKSAWKATTEGRNRFGSHGAWFSLSETEKLRRMTNKGDITFMLMQLQAHNGPNSEFWCTNKFIEGWTTKRTARTRRRLIEEGYIRQIRPARYRSPAVFKWDQSKRDSQI